MVELGVPPVSILLDSFTVFFEEERGPRGHGREIRNVFLLLVPNSFLSYSHIFLVTISKTIIHLLSV